MKRYLTELGGGTWTETQHNWLVKLMEKDYFGEKPDEILELARAGKVKIWDYRDGKGMIITQVLNHKFGKELFVYGMIGAGLFAMPRRIFNELKEIMKSLDCIAIGGLAQNFAHENVFKRVGLASVGIRFMWRE